MKCLLVVELFSKVVSEDVVVASEESYYLGEECEVFDAELYGISKATYLATKLLDQPTTDIWIFCNNQSAVSRMANSIPMPGQEYILRALNNIQTLTDAKIKTHIHWVPGHVNVIGNERAVQLAKKGRRNKNKNGTPESQSPT